MRTYPAKLLLFGEYLLLLGEAALAVPVTSMYGRWQEREIPGHADPSLLQLAQSMEKMADTALQTRDFFNDIQEGLRFVSNIPLGYGMGSSGALVAGAYERYGGPTNLDWGLLKSILAELESTFHGKSSGIDPLVSLLQQPILLKNQHITPFEGKEWLGDRPVVFLIDSKSPRKTEPLVGLFLKKLNLDKGFEKNLLEDYTSVHQNTLESWQQANSREFWDSIKKLSRQQYDLMPEMVAPLNSAFELAFQEDYFALKICGAGGGGFFLGFSDTPERAKYLLGDKFSLIFPFEPSYEENT